MSNSDDLSQFKVHTHRATPRFYLDKSLTVGDKFNNIKNKDQVITVVSITTHSAVERVGLTPSKLDNVIVKIQDPTNDLTNESITVLSRLDVSTLNLVRRDGIGNVCAPVVLTDFDVYYEIIRPYFEKYFRCSKKYSDYYDDPANWISMDTSIVMDIIKNEPILSQYLKQTKVDSFHIQLILKTVGVPAYLFNGTDEQKVSAFFNQSNFRYTERLIEMAESEADIIVSYKS